MAKSDARINVQGNIRTKTQGAKKSANELDQLSRSAERYEKSLRSLDRTQERHARQQARARDIPQRDYEALGIGKHARAAEIYRRQGHLWAKGPTQSSAFNRMGVVMADRKANEALMRQNRAISEGNKLLRDRQNTVSMIAKQWKGVAARMGVAMGVFGAVGLVSAGAAAVGRGGVGWQIEMGRQRARMLGLSGDPRLAHNALQTAIRAGGGTPFTLEESAQAAGIFQGRGVNVDANLLRTAQATSVVLDQPLEQVVNNIAKLSIRSANLKRGLVQLGISWAAWEEQIASGKTNLEALNALLGKNQAVLEAYTATWDTVWKNFRQSFGLASEHWASETLSFFKRWFQDASLAMRPDNTDIDPGLVRRRSAFEKLQYGGGKSMFDRLKSWYPDKDFGPYERVFTKRGQQQLLDFARFDDLPEGNVSPDLGTTIGRLVARAAGADENSLVMRALADKEIKAAGLARGLVEMFVRTGADIGPNVGRQAQIQDTLNRRRQARLDVLGLREQRRIAGLTPLDQATANIENLQKRINEYRVDDSLGQWQPALEGMLNELDLLFKEETRLFMEREARIKAERAAISDARLETNTALRGLRSQLTDDSFTRRDLLGRIRAGGDPRANLVEDLAAAVRFLTRPGLTENERLRGQLERDQAQRALDSFDSDRGLSMAYLRGRIALGVSPTNRQLLDLELQNAIRRRNAAPTVMDRMHGEIDVLEARGALQAAGPDINPIARFGATALQQAFLGIDFSGRRNQQIDRQVEALNRQRMEIQGQIEPLTQVELINTRINELHAQRLSYMEQFQQQLKKQLGQAAVRGISGLLTGAAFAAFGGGLPGFKAGFNIGSGIPAFKAAEGFHDFVSEPTLMLVGEAGRERVDVTPDSHGDMGEEAKVVNIHFHDANFTDPEAAVKILRTAAKGIRMSGESIRGITND